MAGPVYLRPPEQRIAWDQLLKLLAHNKGGTLSCALTLSKGFFSFSLCFSDYAYNIVNTKKGKKQKSVQNKINNVKKIIYLLTYFSLQNLAITVTTIMMKQPLCQGLRHTLHLHHLTQWEPFWTGDIWHFLQVQSSMALLKGHIYFPFYLKKKKKLKKPPIQWYRTSEWARSV